MPLDLFWLLSILIFRVCREAVEYPFLAFGILFFDGPDSANFGNQTTHSEQSENHSNQPPPSSNTFSDFIHPFHLLLCIVSKLSLWLFVSKLLPSLSPAEAYGVTVNYTTVCSEVLTQNDHTVNQGATLAVPFRVSTPHLSKAEFKRRIQTRKTAGQSDKIDNFISLLRLALTSLTVKMELQSLKFELWIPRSHSCGF